MFPLYHFSIHPNQFNHPEDGGSTFLQNVKKINHRMGQKPKQRPSADQQLLYKLENLYIQYTDFSLCSHIHTGSKYHLASYPVGNGASSCQKGSG
jgi:hypothetical protein